MACLKNGYRSRARPPRNLICAFIALTITPEEGGGGEGGEGDGVCVSNSTLNTQHTAHSTQHTAHSTQRTAHSAHSTHTQWCSNRTPRKRFVDLADVILEERVQLSRIHTFVCV